MTPPSSSNGTDRYLWRNGERKFVPKFSTKGTWNLLREPSTQMQWCSLVCFKGEIPRCSFFFLEYRCSFIMWLPVLERLPTRDRLRSWGMYVPTAYTLCSSGSESHTNLFFECPFSISIWTHFCGSFISAPPQSIISISDVLRQHVYSSSPGLSSVLKLLLHVIVYCLWRERNSRIFRLTSSSEATLIAKVDRLVRDRLLSFMRRLLTVHHYCIFFSLFLIMYNALLPSFK